MHSTFLFTLSRHHCYEAEVTSVQRTISVCISNQKDRLDLPVHLIMMIVTLNVVVLRSQKMWFCLGLKTYKSWSLSTWFLTRGLDLRTSEAWVSWKFRSWSSFLLYSSDENGVNHFQQLEMWANAQRDGRPAEYRWRPLFNAAKFGLRPLLDAVQ